MIITALLLALALAAFCAAGVVAYRNKWVFSQRTGLLLAGRHEEYDSLLSYGEMMAKWLVWDIEKLRKPAEKSLRTMDEKDFDDAHH